AFSYQPVLTTLTETGPSRRPGAPAGSYLNRDQGGAGVPGGVLEVLAVAFVAVLGFVDRHATPVCWVVILGLLAFFPGLGVGEAGPDGVVQVEALAVPGRDDRVRGDVRVVGLVDRPVRFGQGRAGRQGRAVGAVEREVCAAGPGGGSRSWGGAGGGPGPGSRRRRRGSSTTRRRCRRPSARWTR